MSDDGLVLIDDEDIPLAVDALLGVVVGDGLLQAEGDVEVHGLPHEGLGVGGGIGLTGTAFVPAGAEGNAVVDDHPGVLGLHNARGGIGIGVVEPRRRPGRRRRRRRTPWGRSWVREPGRRACLLEPAHRVGACCLSLKASPSNDDPHSWVLGQPFSVVGVLIASKTAVYRLPEQSHQLVLVRRPR